MPDKDLKNREQLLDDLEFFLGTLTLAGVQITTSIDLLETIGEKQITIFLSHQRDLLRKTLGCKRNNNEDLTIEKKAKLDIFETGTQKFKFYKKQIRLDLFGSKDDSYSQLVTAISFPRRPAAEWANDYLQRKNEEIEEKKKDYLN
jgi:hypothetical protein